MFLWNLRQLYPPTSQDGVTVQHTTTGYLTSVWRITLRYIIWGFWVDQNGPGGAPGAGSNEHALYFAFHIRRGNFLISFIWTQCYTIQLLRQKSEDSPVNCSRQTEARQDCKSTSTSTCLFLCQFRTQQAERHPAVSAGPVMHQALDKAKCLAFQMFPI